MATLRAKCLEAAQKAARMREADDNGYAICKSCKQPFHYKEGDGGHFIPKGDSSYWALDARNIHFQCKGCNGFGMKYGIAAQQYTVWMQGEYGEEFVNQMFRDKKKVKKMYKADYEDLLKELKAEIKQHEERIA